MAIASVPTKLSLDRWASILGIHPLHFNQVTYTPTDRSPAACDGGFLQYDWQAADQVSREQIARAIFRAEQALEHALGYRLAPAWEIEEWVQGPRPYQRELVNNGRAIPIFRGAVEARWKEVITGGVETRTLIEASSPIVWSDTDGDGLDDTGTVTTVVGSGQAPCEIEIYYPGHQGDPRYQIRSSLVTVSGTTATITFRRWHAVVEEVLEALTPEPASLSNADDFLEEVDIYRHWNDPSTQATLMWEPSGCALCGSGLSGCSSCSYSVQTACLFLRSTPRVGMLAYSPGEWDPDTETFDFVDLAMGRGPDLIRLYYYAGKLGDPWGCDNEMSEEMAQIVTHLSLTFLDRPACQCTSDVWDYWREIPDLGRSNEAVKQLSNPFGTMRGALDAWNRVNDGSNAVARSTTLV